MLQLGTQAAKFKHFGRVGSISGCALLGEDFWDHFALGVVTGIPMEFQFGTN
jgi:cytochrome bd-type quinol oxidase subunit 1